MSAPPNTERSFRLLVEGVSNYAIYMLDPEGRVASWNRGAEQIKQYTAEEILGRHFGEFYPPEARERGEPDHNLQIARERGRFEETGWRLRKDGSRFWAHVLIDPLRDEHGALIGFAKVTSDMTERKRTEEALVQAQKMESIGQLSAGIAHDFNNLLTVILGNAELLSDLLKARQDLRHLADDIGHAGQRGAELTQRLLAFGRRQTLMPVELDCNALLDSMQKLLRRTLREDILIDAELDCDLHAAYADRAQLESAILNLALNAQDAMPGGGRLSITTANVKLDQSYQMINQDVRPGAYVMLALTDNGCGMTAEVLEHAFEPFYTTKDAGKGSGLGLSMVYGFAKQSNGHVSIYSEPELGTTVRLYLPAAPSYAALPRSEGGDERVTTADVAKGEAVLIVEDDADVRSYAVRCLSSLGYTVVAAMDGEDAWQKLTGPTAFDVLFTDVVMPGGLSGWALAEAALARRPDLRVLLTSGYALDSIAGRSRSHSAFPILTKPYHKSELGRRLREVIDGPPPAVGDEGREDPSSASQAATRDRFVTSH